MNKVSHYTLFMLFSVMCSGQMMAQDEEAAYSIYNENGSSMFLDMSNARPVRGGTKFIVTYPDDWSEEQQGAFQYACELWEEILPTTFPIRITVNSQKKTQSITNNSTLSKIVSRSIPSIYQYHSSIAYSTEIKATVFMQMTGQYTTNYYIDIFDNSYFIESDIEITYYEYADKSYEDLYSFSMNASNTGNKYDFITCALRDIAKGLGFQGTWPIRNGKLAINRERINPYMNHVRNQLSFISSDENYFYYSIPTSGQTTVETDYVLYTPNPWNSHLSLNSFIPTSGNALSQLLRWDFGTGDVCRDLSDSHTYNAFEQLLSWKGSYAVGMGGNSSVQQIGLNSNEVVPMGGNIVFEMPQNSTNSSLISNLQKETENLNKMLTTQNRDGQIGLGYYTGLQYHPAYRTNGTTNSEGHTLAVLKKDGTWDVVYEDDVTILPNITISPTNMTFHAPDSVYARNYEGRYRFRLSFSRLEYDYLYHTESLQTTTKYYLVGTYPQRVKSEMHKCKFMPEYDYLYDEYTGVIKVGLKDLEGVTRVEIAQYDEGNFLPLLYSVPNYKDGYFHAVVDREFDTRFVITAYNENGYTASEIYNFHPSPDAFNMTVHFVRRGNNIYVESNSRKNSALEIKSAEIRPLMSSMPKNRRNAISLNKNIIDISLVKSGYYVLDITDNKNNHHFYKFTK